MFSGFYLFIPPPVPSSSRVFDIRVLGDAIRPRADPLIFQSKNWWGSKVLSQGMRSIRRFHSPPGLILNIKNSVFLNF